MMFARNLIDGPSAASDRLPANDNQFRQPAASPPVGGLVFPPDAIARIYRPGRSVTTSARRSAAWRLVFERRTAPFIEPLMGYTGGKDTLTQVELSFPTLQSAIDYAERQGLNYVVQGLRSGDLVTAAYTGQQEIFSEIAGQQLRRAWLESRYSDGSAAAQHYQAALAAPEAIYSAAIDVVRDQRLTQEQRRAVLKNWAWNEYLVDLATAEGMPENSRPSRLDEVELALATLEAPVALVSQAAPMAIGAMAPGLVPVSQSRVTARAA